MGEINCWRCRDTGIVVVSAVDVSAGISAAQSPSKTLPCPQRCAATEEAREVGMPELERKLAAEDELTERVRRNCNAALRRMAPAFEAAVLQTMETIAAERAGLCEQCGRGDPMPGILVGANGSETVEVCDVCLAYPSDLAAAYALAQRVGGVVKFWQHDAELEQDTDQRVREGGLEIDYDPAEVGFELREFDGTGQADDCIRFGTCPWIEIDGRVVDWEHYRRISAAFAGER